LCVKIASWDDSDVGEERAAPGDMLKSAFAPVGDGEEMVRFKDPTHFIDNRTCAPAVCDGRGVTLYMYIETLTYTNTYTYIYILLCMCIYICVYIHVCIYIYICIYICMSHTPVEGGLISGGHFGWQGAPQEAPTGVRGVIETASKN
jgi:hypothetical protein